MNNLLSPTRGCESVTVAKGGVRSANAHRFSIDCHPFPPGTAGDLPHVCKLARVSSGHGPAQHSSGTHPTGTEQGLEMAGPTLPKMGFIVPPPCPANAPLSDSQITDSSSLRPPVR